MTKIELPENVSPPEKYLKISVIGPIGAIEVLMGFQQHSMFRPSIYLPTEVNSSV